MSSSGEMKISLREMTCGCQYRRVSYAFFSYILVSQMFQQLEFSVGSFRQDRCRKRLHDLLDGDGLAGQLIFSRTVSNNIRLSVPCIRGNEYSPDETEGTHANRLEIRISKRPSARKSCKKCQSAIPRGDLKRRPENLGPYKLRHDGRLCVD